MRTLLTKVAALARRRAAVGRPATPSGRWRLPSTLVVGLFVAAAMVPLAGAQQPSGPDQLTPAARADEDIVRIHVKFREGTRVRRRSQLIGA